jgi:cytosine permease
MTAATQERHLESEYEHEPVPRTHRRRLASVSAVWFGFPMILTNAVFGGTIVYGLGFWKGISAIIIGNLILLGYVGSLSYVAGHSGKNFALTAAETFGRTGAKITAGFLSTVVIGWFAFQTGLTGSTLQGSLHWNETLTIVVAGVLYTVITFVGIRALTIIGLIAAPLFVALAIVALVFVSRDGHLGDFASYRGAAPGTLSIGAAITIVVAGFADSGTMTADFTRWSRSGREAVMAAFSAFPVANFISLLVGGLVVAVGAATDPASNGGDFLSIITAHGAVLTALAVIFVFANLGSVCAHCLYNGAVGWSQLTGSRMRLLTVILGVIGLIAAAAGVWNYFSDWLNILGIFVPPIGAVLISDQIIGHRHHGRAVANLRITPFIAWACGAAGAFVVHEWAPAWCEAITGIVISALAYGAAEALSSARAAVPAVADADLDSAA